MPQPQTGCHCVVCGRWFDIASIKAAAEHSLGKHCRTLIPCLRTLVAALLAAQPVRPVLTGALVCVGTLVRRFCTNCDNCLARQSSSGTKQHACDVTPACAILLRFVCVCVFFPW